MKNDAEFSECRKYRYALWRTWDDAKPYAMFIGLNPSTADEVNDDPTITRCINYAKEWGYGGLCMTNLFAYRATEPNEMMLVAEPIGLENDDWLKKLAKDAGVIVAAWGNNGAYLGRSSEILAVLPNLKCLKKNQTGEPAHPLYQSKSAELIPM